jgi:eukaryotic-like serine/threonine-protein kinase
MTEESIFTEALAKRTPAHRATYLDEVCGGDANLRHRIEELLRSHDGGGGFLEVPVAIQLGLGEAQPADRTGAASVSLPLQPTATHELHRDPTPDTHVDPRSSELDGAPVLDFLDPPQEPGSLGWLGHYDIKEVVGQGGMGVVLRAFDTKLHRIVAIKVMALELAASATARRRFSREAQAAAAVCHEHVVTIHAVDEDHRPPYLVMQFVQGSSLQEKLDRDGVPRLLEILRIGLQTAEGLAAAHKQGLVHRDIKPANILLENGVERVKITDFGLARAADDASLTQSGVIAGTPQFMSPEQADGAAVDQRSDLFSLGSVLYATCTGRAPFHASSSLAVLKRVVEDNPRPIREINPEIPDWLCDLIARLQAKDPAQRPGSAGEVASILTTRLSEVQNPARSVDSSDTRVERRRDPAPAYVQRAAQALPSSHRWLRRLLAGVAAVLAVLIGIGLSEATGVTHVLGTVIRLVRPEGTLVIEADDPAVSVSIDGDNLVITGDGIHEFRLRPGIHELSARKGNTVLRREVLEIERGGRRLVRVTTAPPAQPAAVVAQPAATAATQDWATTVFHLPVKEQVRAVSARLKEVNPGFDGNVEARYENGTVSFIGFCTDQIRDISPLGALRELRVIDAKGSDKFRGRLADLGPLQELRGLIVLQLMNNDVRSLAPLRGLRLGFIGLGFNPVDDLTPLAGMPLGTAHLYNTKVSDLSPLAGMPLRDLHLVVTSVRDLSPLKNMPLEELAIGYTSVTDLSPLKGMPLKHLNIDGTKVTKLELLIGMPLREFQYFDTPIDDISVLKAMRLEKVRCDFKPERDAAILRSIATLKTINGKPAAEFWKDVDLRAGVAKSR